MKISDPVNDETFVNGSVFLIQEEKKTCGEQMMFVGRIVDDGGLKIAYKDFWFTPKLAKPSELKEVRIISYD